MVMVNLPTAGVDYHVPFGGRKGSSYGPREQGRYAVEFYTTVKTSLHPAGLTTASRRATAVTIARRAALGGITLLLARPVRRHVPILPEPGLLPPDGFSWQPETAPQGPVLVLVSIVEQVARVYRNGVEIGIARVSTGRPGYPTPTGVFTILQKARVHHSSTYDEASMPYTERLTWDGVALHAGGVPGYPSSHGCVHLPLEFADLLYGVTEVGTTVVIADAHRVPGRPRPSWPGGADGRACRLARATSGRRSVAARAAQPAGQRRRPALLRLSQWRRDRPGDRQLRAAGRAGAACGLSDARSAGRRGQAGLDGGRAVRGCGGSDALGRARPAHAAAAVRRGAARRVLVPGTSLYCALGSATSDSRTGPGFTVVSARPA